MVENETYKQNLILNIQNALQVIQESNTSLKPYANEIHAVNHTLELLISKIKSGKEYKNLEEKGWDSYYMDHYKSYLLLPDQWGTIITFPNKTRMKFMGLNPTSKYCYVFKNVDTGRAIAYTKTAIVNRTEFHCLLDRQLLLKEAL